MIIRRRHTANFTIVTNAIFNDERLTIEERGALAWLISRPNDFEVSRGGCSKIWKLGRDKTKRILRRLVETGWAREELLRDPAGVFLGMRYTVTDECGPEQEFVDEDEVVSDRTSVVPDTENPSMENQTPVGNPVTGFRVAVLRTESQRTEETPKPPTGAFSEDVERRFQQLKSGYPDGILDLDRARAAFGVLSEHDQGAALAAVAVYAARCRKRREKSVKAHIFLKRRSWEGLMADPAGDVAGPTLYAPDSAEGRAIAILYRIARYKPLSRQDGLVAFRHPMTVQLAALAQAPFEGEWRIYERHSPSFTAWSEYKNKYLAGLNLIALTEIRAPWPWPPSLEGKLYRESPPSTAGPSLMTEEDERELTHGL